MWSASTMADLESTLDDLEFLQQIEDSMINDFQNHFEDQKRYNPEEAEQDPQDYRRSKPKHFV